MLTLAERSNRRKMSSGFSNTTDLVIPAWRYRSRKQAPGVPESEGECRRKETGCRNLSCYTRGTRECNSWKEIQGPTHVHFIFKQAKLEPDLCFPGGSVVKNPPAKQQTWVQSLGRSPGEGNGNPLQHSCLGNSMDRAAWEGIVHGVTKSQI